MADETLNSEAEIRHSIREAVNLDQISESIQEQYQHFTVSNVNEVQKLIAVLNIWMRIQYLWNNRYRGNGHKTE